MPGDPCPDRQQAVRVDDIRLPLQRERVDRVGVDRVPRQGERLLADQDLARPGRLFQACGGVDRVPGDERLTRARIPGHDGAGVDADPCLQRHGPLAFEVGVQLGEGGLHLVRCPNRPDGVVLVDDRDPEHRHHGVADELLDGAAVGLEHGLHPLEVARHHGAQ